MKGNNRQLTLVSFSSTSHHNSLHKCLVDEGITVNIVNGHHWLTEKSTQDHSPVILFFDQQGWPRDKIKSIFSKVNKMPWLGIFYCQDVPWTCEILRQCTEFLPWPCQEQELMKRLDQLDATIECSTNYVDDVKALQDILDIKLVGNSPVFLEILKMIKKVAPFGAPVLIQGETGTGKEVAARAIHQLSTRQDGPFIPVNCGAIPDSLLESELFGHKKGAFTDAKEECSGVVAQANKGTLFLDEIDALSPKAQITLLRFLQDHKFKPLGGHRLQKTDVRVIAASNIDLQVLVDREIFRRDLFFRLNIVSLELPPLRERLEDIEVLAEHFIQKYSAAYKMPKKAVHPHALCSMKAYHWPGNIRELDNMIHRGFLISDESVIHATDIWDLTNLDSTVSQEENKLISYEDDFNRAKAKVIEDFERKYLDWLMADVRGNVTLAARRAGKERRALGKLLKKYGIERRHYVLER